LQTLFQANFELKVEPLELMALNLIPNYYHVRPSNLEGNVVVVEWLVRVRHIEHVIQVANVIVFEIHDHLLACYQDIKNNLKM
jgi:hypothetical protein